MLWSKSLYIITPNILVPLILMPVSKPKITLSNRMINLGESFAYTQLKRNSNNLFWIISKGINLKYNGLRSKLESETKKIHVCSQGFKLFLISQQVHFWLRNIMKIFENINDFLLVKLQKQWIDIRIFDELQ